MNMVKVCHHGSKGVATMSRVLRIALTSFVVVTFAAVLPACNTVKGAGKDIQEGAEATERAIDGK
jgi:predicted small secreted protein